VGLRCRLRAKTGEQYGESTVNCSAIEFQGMLVLAPPTLLRPYSTLACVLVDYEQATHMSQATRNVSGLSLLIAACLDALETMAVA
jgi:hypothetical protein